MSRTRHRKRLSNPSGVLPADHDGILDVLANLVGVLTLVGALTAILAANSAIKIKTPLARDTRQEFVMLQVGKDGVWDLQTAKARLFALDKQRIDELNSCLNLSLFEMVECVQAMESWSASETVGQVTVDVSSDGARMTRLASPTERSDDLEKPNSWIRKKIEGTAKSNSAIFVILEKQGFENYRKIRSIAGENGVLVGWEPWETGAAVFFGSQGRNMNVQYAVYRESFIAAELLARAQGLAEAADNALVLTTDELVALGVKGVDGLAGDSAYGYVWGRHSQRNRTLWTVD